MAKKNQETKTLLQLIAEHPELPVIPMVTSEIIADNSYSRWIASFGMARVDEYYVGSERVFFKSDRDPGEVEELVEDMAGDERFDQMDDEALNTAYDNAPWTRAIVVNIDPPEN